MLDTVKLGYEIWRILNAFPPSVQAPQIEAPEAPAAKKKAGGAKDK